MQVKKISETSEETEQMSYDRSSNRTDSSRDQTKEMPELSCLDKIKADLKKVSAYAGDT